jgi:hypothetical protein
MEEAAAHPGTAGREALRLLCLPAQLRLRGLQAARQESLQA